MLFRTEDFKFIAFLKYFIIFQPILDILTYFSIIYLEQSITIGIIIRVLFMGLCTLYIFFGGNQYSLKKYIITYLLLLFIVLGIGLIINFMNKPVFDVFSELQFYLKTVYYPILFCTILLLFSDDRNQNQTQQTLLSSITIAMLITAISMFVAILTGTASTTYKSVKAGYTGWYFAGNEIGAIVAICFPLLLIYSIKKTEQLRDFIYWIPTILLSICALWIGTKVSYLGILITIIVTVVVNIIVFLYSKWKNTNWKKTINKILLFNIVTAVFYFGVFPFSPAYKNITGEYANINEVVKENSHDSAAKAKKEAEKKRAREKQKYNAENENDFIINSQVLNILLSSRDNFFYPIYNDYRDASLAHKLFGLGYAGFYEGEPKLIEMDFFDIFFSYGILGFILIFMPLFIVFWKVIKTLFTHFSSFFRIENILLLFSLGLGLGVAFLAGHVLFAPAVSIYLTITMALLFHFHTTNSDSRVKFK